MSDLDLIIAASKAADDAARSTRALPPVVVDPLLVDHFVASLKDAAVNEKRRDPSATSFPALEWSPRDREQLALGYAIRDRLRGIGLDLIESVTDDGNAILRGIRVDYESLKAIGDREVARRATWLDDVKMAWMERFDDAGNVGLHATGSGDIVVFQGPQPVEVDPSIALANPHADPRARPEWRTDLNWHARSPAETVAAALDALKIPAWSFEAVAKLWAEKAGGEVVRHRGLYAVHGMRDVPTLVFRRNDVEHAVAVEDVYAMTAESLVAKVIAEAPKEMGLHVFGDGGGKHGKGKQR